jgi:A/G-specific adenine glycosylase
MPRSSCIEPAVRNKFRRELLRWYKANRRDLPWRANRDPYGIWISEVMLQQTRVGAVMGHYAAFLRKFPDIPTLAKARESEVLAAWSGLGYYRRARALHRAAKQVMSAHGGQVPQAATALMKLPGIGRYTSNAIASIAFGEPVPVVDGNVDRVLTRFMGRSLSEAELWNVAGDLLERRQPGDFNQALMEFGATLCTPQSPKCGECPVHALCATRGKVERKRASSRGKIVEIDYTLARSAKSVYLVRRSASESLMPNMWELPQNGRPGKLIARLNHSITSNRYVVNVREGTGELKAGRWVPVSRLPQLALTGLTRKILRNLRIASII